MGKGTYLAAQKNKTIFFKLEGDIKYTMSIGFDKYLDRVISKDAVEHVVFDLTDTEFIDSTNLGLLAKMGEYVRRQHQNTPIIISPNGNVTAVLESVGFDNYFSILDEYRDNVDEYSEIPGIKGDDLESAKTILKAHKNLITLNEENKSVFQDIVTLIEKEIETKELES